MTDDEQGTAQEHGFHHVADAWPISPDIAHVSEWQPRDPRDVLPDWTLYPEEEFMARLAIITDELAYANVPQNKYVTTERQMGEALSWARSLELIPTKHLGRIFKRATQMWDSDFPMTAGYVKRLYEEYKLEMAQEAQLPDNYALPAPEEADYDTQGRMSVTAWKELHNLPASWRMGDPYPEYSDLFFPVQPPTQTELTTEEMRLSKEIAERFSGDNWPAKWFKGQKLPWEIYPNRENPRRSTVAVRREEVDANGYKSIRLDSVEVVWWFDRCIEIDHPANECPGYIEEHSGPGGERVTRRRCPFHWQRWNGM